MKFIIIIIIGSSSSSSSSSSNSSSSEIKSDTGNNRGNWNHLKITQTVPEQYTGRARNQGTTKTAVQGTAHIIRKVLM